MSAEYQLRVNGSTLVLRENESTAEEISHLLTARFGVTEAGSSKAVALEDAATSLIFPLNVVAARPDVVSQSERLLVLFSWTQSTQLLRRLGLTGQLSEQEIRMLTPLCDDPYVTAAFEVYQAEGDETDLVDTLQRIVAIRLGNNEPSSSTKQQQQPTSTEQQPVGPSGQELLEQLTAALKLEEFPTKELLGLFQNFVNEGKISRSDNVVLIQLAQKSLPHLQAAYEIYLEEKNSKSLLDALKRISKYFGIERIVRKMSNGQIILQAFEEGNPMVCGAWDVYVDEHNEEDFKDTLIRCGKRLGGDDTQKKEGGVQQLSSSSTKPSEEKTGLRRFIIWLHSEGKIDSEQGYELMTLVDSGSTQAENAMKSYLASTRDDAAREQLTQTVLYLLEQQQQQGGEKEDVRDLQEEEEEEEQHFEEDSKEDEELRETISLFLDDLVEDGVLKEEEGNKLKTLVDSKDARLLAAFDLFNDERDLDDLVDTLQRLASKVFVVEQEDQDEEIFDDEEQEEDEDSPIDLETLFEVIMGMDFSAEQLEIIRDAMQMRHPDVEDAIDNYAENQDEQEFKSHLVNFCNNQL